MDENKYEKWWGEQNKRESVDLAGNIERHLVDVTVNKLPQNGEAVWIELLQRRARSWTAISSCNLGSWGPGAVCSFSVYFFYSPSPRTDIHIFWDTICNPRGLSCLYQVHSPKMYCSVKCRNEIPFKIVSTSWWVNSIYKYFFICIVKKEHWLFCSLLM